VKLEQKIDNVRPASMTADDQPLPQSMPDSKLTQKIEEQLKWKMEAHNRKITDRVQTLEERQMQTKKMLDIVTNECHEEFQLIKTQMIEVTTDILHQVQD
jgi:hypothetical protein